jgi:hypothetical protein
MVNIELVARGMIETDVDDGIEIEFVCLREHHCSVLEEAWFLSKQSVICISLFRLVVVDSNNYCYDNSDDDNDEDCINISIRFTAQ